MSKMNELSQVLDEMIACAERMIDTANVIKKIFTDTEEAEEEKPTPAKNAQEEAKEPETKTYTFAQVRKAFSAKSHEGYTEQVRALIAKYGAEKLSGVKEEDYPALMADLEVIE